MFKPPESIFVHLFYYKCYPNSLILSYLILPSLVLRHIKLNILISATLNLFSCWFFTAQHSLAFILLKYVLSYFHLMHVWLIYTLMDRGVLGIVRDWMLLIAVIPIIWKILQCRYKNTSIILWLWILYITEPHFRYFCMTNVFFPRIVKLHASSIFLNAMNV